MNGQQTQPSGTPGQALAQSAQGGSGQGSGSALDAMLRKRRQGENESTDAAPQKPEVDVPRDK
jgi:hypothetical protein